MSFQFIHVESYARKAGKSKAGGLTIKKVADEADRIPGSFPHVKPPEKPIIRFGTNANQAAKVAEKWAESSKDLSGHTLRQDGLCLLAGIISYPNEMTDWENFRDSSIEWLKKKYGDCLKSVVEHTDESNPHIHFYCVPRAGERFETIHDGRKASQEAKAGGQLKGAQNAAFKEAMRGFQDEFSSEVAMSSGLTRIGPGRRRLTRVAWQREQQQAKFFANARAQHKQVRRKARKEGYEQGHAKAAAEIEANKKAFESVGQSAGSFVKGFIADMHAPTKKIKKEAEEAEARASKAEEEKKKAVKDAVEKEKSKNKLELDDLRRENAKLKRIAESIYIEQNPTRPELDENYSKKSKLKY